MRERQAHVMQTAPKALTAAADLHIPDEQDALSEYSPGLETHSRHALSSSTVVSNESFVAYSIPGDLLHCESAWSFVL